MCMVAHACNSSYLGGLWFKNSLGQKLVRPQLNKKAGHMYASVISGTWRLK
jgi:hypothetical protein